MSKPSRGEADMAGDYTKSEQQPPEPVPSDYDEDPDRVRLARSVLRRHAVAGDVHELVARRFVAEGLARVLDVGCGEGELARYLSDGAWVGLDNSQTMLNLLSYATEVNVEPGLTEDGAAESSTALGWLCRRVGC
jgi:SAM-dependent methyltransferase